LALRSEYLDVLTGAFGSPLAEAEFGGDVEAQRMLINQWVGEQTVELPYGGGALSMVVIVPTDLAEFEASLTVQSLETVIDSIEDGGIHLSLPKWADRTHLTLNDTLSALGMPSAFSGSADFSGMIDGEGL
jgi:serine protease inhibitor